MPDYGWAYINLDVLKDIHGPTGSILIKSSSTELSGSKFLAYATASNKVGIGLNFPTVLPSYQLDVSASSGQAIAARYVGDVVISGSTTITGSLTVATLHADTIISSSNLIVRDEVIGLGFGSGSAHTGSVGDRGFVFGLAGNLNQALLWDQTSGSFILGKVGATGPEATAFDIPEANLSKLKVSEVTGSKGRIDRANGNIVITGSLSAATTTLGAVTATTISGSSTLQAVGATILGNNLTVSGSSTLQAVTATTISGSNTLQAVGPTILGNNLTVSGSSTLKELFSTEISASGGMQIVNESILGGNLTVSGTVSIDNNISGSGTFQAVGSTILGNSLTVSGSAAFDNTISGSNTLQAVGATILGSTLTVSGAVALGSTVKAGSLGADTDNTVVIVNGSNFLKTDEIDARVWGTTLVDGAGASGQLTLWNDANTVQGSSALTYNGSALLVDDAISGSGTLQAVGDSVFGGKLNVSSSATFASSVSGSSTLQAVGNTTLGGTLATSGSLTGSNVLYVEASTNRVGINRPTPSAMLHMSQSSAYPKGMLNPVIRVDHVLDADSGGGGGPTTTPLFILTGSAPGGEDFAEGRLGINKAAPAGALHIVSKGSDTLVAEQGKVAIGHAGPGSILDVRGDQRLFRVVNTKNEYENTILFASGAGDGLGHFGTSMTGSSFHVSGTSHFNAITSSVGVDIAGGDLYMGGGVMVEYLEATDEDAQNVALSVAEFRKGIVVHTSTTGAGAVTMDTAANLVAGLGLSANNMTAHCYYINDGNQDVAFSGAATGVTYADTGCKIKENCAGTILVRRTGASAVTVYIIGGS